MTLLALALAPWAAAAGPSAAEAGSAAWVPLEGQPGWIRERVCVPGPPDGPVPADTGAVADSGGARPIARPGGKDPAGSPWLATDSLRPPGGLGSVARLRVFRDGQALLAGQDYRIAPGDSLLHFAAPVPGGDSICLERATTPLMADPTFDLYRFDRVPIYRIGLADTSGSAQSFGASAAGDTAYSRYRLNYSGSKSMSVTVGSGGGLGLDASLFINLDGQVAEDVFVEGQLSDQNVPVQPEGNTATLKEVDTKFMKVYGSRYAYILGDYLLDYGVAGEDRYTAKVEGVDGSYFRNGYALRGNFSVSDGQYQSDTLRGVDGKQRGYYLRGRDGRQFITVLAGTERVWRNGVPIRRGVDYTIDYSEGRLDFIPPLVVTSENLFSAEFQYTEQDYPRSLTSGEIRDSAGALTWSVRAISELENKDNPRDFVLDSALLRRFEGLGDSAYSDTGGAVRMPARQSAAAANLALKLGGSAGRASLLLSQWDRNLYSAEDDADNLGYSTRYSGSHALGSAIDLGGWGRTDLFLDHEFRNAHYEAFKQLVEPRGFQETWNLDARVARRGFMANRLRVEERPFRNLMLAGELGRADADAAADTASADAGQGSLSRRGGLSAHLGGEKTFLETSTEAKLARSPDRRDNYRQYGRLRVEAAGVAPSFSWTRNEWLALAPSGALARSEKQEPELSVSTLPFLGGVSLATGLSVLSQRSNFDGRLPDLRDSVRNWGASQKVEVLGLGPWTTDVFYSYRNHRQWRFEEPGGYATIPEESDFNQVEWNSQLSDRRKGYGFTSSYRVNQTAEFPLVEDFRKLEGRGDYIRDSATGAHHKVETGGDYVLVGLMRDTTVGSNPYQDLAWNATFELVPARFPFPVTGVLADIELSLDLALENQDTSAGPGLLPLFTDSRIEAARSGRSRYAPALRWKSPAGGKAANLYVDRSFTLAAGVYAFKEKLWNERAEYRSEVGEDWEYFLEQSYENRERLGLSTSSAGNSANRNQAYGLRLARKLPASFTLEGRGQYLLLRGESSLDTSELQGVKPALKLEKSSLYKGRAFVEYGLIYFWGRGEGGFYATGDFAKGMTHRAQANANFQMGENIQFNFDYVIRLEPEGRRLVQKLTAEARAVF